MSKDNARRPEDLGGMGESYFRLLAKDAGLVANASSDDKAGWDFEIESPSPLAINYADQARPVLRVQVKSTMGADLAVSMTFSSLLSLVQFAGPAFVVLLAFSDGMVPESVYLLHVDDELGMRILTTLRRREVSDAGVVLNKSRMTLAFAGSDCVSPANGSELARRMREAVGTSYLEYVHAKAARLRQIEEDSEKLRFSIQVEAESEIRAMADCFLGFETPFKVRSVGYVAPMGIPDTPVVHTQEAHSTTIKPIEGELPQVIVRLTAEEFGPSYEFKGVVYSVPSQLPRQLAAVRIHTALFDIIWRLESDRIEFRVADLMNSELRSTVVELRSFMKYGSASRRGGETKLEVIHQDGGAPLRVSLGVGQVQVSDQFEEIERLLESVYLKLAALNLASELMCPADMFTKQGHFGFLHHVGSAYNPPLAFEFRCDDDFAPGAEVVVFSAPVPLVAASVLCYGAFFGHVEDLGSGALRGVFSRSEYLGEIVVPVGADLDAARRVCGDRFQDQLRRRGLKVL